VGELTLDQWLKITQLVFYVLASVAVFLTYLNARRGFLNTVNTEYQKQVIQRLRELAQEFASEFDRDSPDYWAKSNESTRIFGSLYDQALKWRNTDRNEPFLGTLVIGQDATRLSKLLQAVRSDPFIPNKIREHLIDFLSNRVEVLNSVRRKVWMRFAKHVNDGTYDLSDRTWAVAGLHNIINDALIERGCGIEQNDEDVHRLRLLIQKHFESFNPLGR
jgi:hypothetical protein